MKWNIEALSRKRSAKYDVVMKHFISPRHSALRQMLKVGAAESITTEFSNLHAIRADALFRISGKHLAHVEFQTRWEPDMAWRMLEYLLRIVETHGDGVGKDKLTIDQTVVYIGTSPLPKVHPIDNRRDPGDGKLFYSIRAVDIRGWAPFAGSLLGSRQPDDWVLGLLCRERFDLADWKSVATKIARLGSQRPDVAARACAMLLVAGTLRNIDESALERIRDMTLVLNVEDTMIFKNVFDRGELAEAISAVHDAVVGQGIEPEEWEAKAVLELDIDDLRTLRRTIPRMKNLEACLEHVGVERPPGLAIV